MLFNSINFALFLPLVVLSYYLMAQRFRWVLLLASSYFFYMCWNPAYVLLIVASTLVDYWAGLQMGKHHQKRQRRSFLFVSLAFNLGMLFFFKYYGFFSQSLSFLSENLRFPSLDFLLPVGISFYTFQTLSYTIDVYRGAREPEKHLGIFALYVAFFPQLVAGPIERSTHFLPQLHKPRSFDEARTVSALRQILWGLFKKIVVADRLAIFVDSVYGNVGMHSGATYLIATYFFAFQIYCDFSAYSDIAIGSARLLGYELLQNFRSPYFSRSLSEFWRRWHITLGGWFREYVYIPLGGSKSGNGRLLLNLMIVFLLSGLWHGANWTFVIWGAIHGTWICLSRLTESWRSRFSLKRFPKAQQLFQLVITFHLVCFAWIFFRAESLADAWEILQSISSFKGKLYVASASQFAYGLLSIAMLLACEALWLKPQLQELLSHSRPLRWTSYLAASLLILLIGVFDGGQFIYFQF